MRCTLLTIGTNYGQELRQGGEASWAEPLDRMCVAQELSCQFRATERSQSAPTGPSPFGVWTPSALGISNLLGISTLSTAS